MQTRTKRKFQLANLPPADLAKIAAQEARDNHNNNFSSWRGIYVLDDLIVIYNNHPYKQVGYRDTEHRWFRAWCVDAGVDVVAEGTAGDVDMPDYTHVFLLHADGARLTEIREASQNCVGKFTAVELVS